MTFLMKRLATFAIPLALLAFYGSSFAQAQPLIVYSPQGDERAGWITQQAKAAGHDIEILVAGGGELFDRLLAEKANPQADVVFGLVDISMALLKKEGLFQPYVPTWADGLDDVYKDPDGIIHKFWQTPIVIAYNADKLSAQEAPRSWLDLTKPEYKGKYVIGSTTWQTTRTYLAGILARFLNTDGEVTDEGWAFMETLYNNAIYADSSETMLHAYTQGGAVINLNWFGGVFTLANNAGYTPAIVNTQGGTPFITEGISIMAATDQLDQAKAFVDWFGSPEFMSAYAKKFGQAPVHPRAIALSPQQVRHNTTLVDPQAIDWDAIADKLDGWLQYIELNIK